MPLQVQKDEPGYQPPKTGRIAKVTAPPTPGMKSSAKEGLRLVSQWGKGGTKRSLELAAEISAGEPLNVSEWSTIARQHAGSYGIEDPQPYIESPEGEPDSRYIRALLHGGNAGQDTANELVYRLRQRFYEVKKEGKN